MVPVEGIEPPCLAAHDFESCASTSSATRANGLSISSAAARVYPMPHVRVSLCVPHPHRPCFRPNSWQIALAGDERAGIAGRG